MCVCEEGYKLDAYGETCKPNPDLSSSQQCRHEDDCTSLNDSYCHKETGNLNWPIVLWEHMLYSPPNQMLI